MAEKRPDPPLCRYSVDGLDFLHATNWSEHQKISHPTPSKIWPCPVHELHVSGTVRSKNGVALVEFGTNSGMRPE